MKERFNAFLRVLSHPLNTRPLAVCSIMFFIFTVLRLYVPVQPLLVLIFFTGTTLLLLKMFRKITMFIVIFIVSALLMSVVMTSNRVLHSEWVMKTFDYCHSRIEGTIASFPDTSEDIATFYLTADKVYSNKGAVCDNVKIFVKTKDFGFEFGDKLVFNGYLKRTDSNNTFSKYYISKGAVLRTKDITILEKRRGNLISRGLTALRNRTIEASEKLRKDETKMLFRAIVAGDRTSFSDEFSDALTKSGISHIASVSGLHVSLVGMGIYSLLKRRRRIAMIVSFASVALFTVFTGAAPSTMRAAMMFTVYLLSKVNLRQNDSFTALTLSAAILSAINPYVVYDWGFILSFLSVLGIEIFAKDFSSWLRFLPKFVRESIAITIAAQLMTIPAITIMFGNISSYVIISNIIVSVVFTYALSLSLLLVFIYSIPFVGTVFAVLCTFLLDIICVTAVTFSDLPYSYVGIEAFSLVQLICYYSVVVLYVFRKELSIKAFSVMIGIVATVLVFNYFYSPQSEKEYLLADNSYIYLSKDFSKLVLYDDAEEVKKDVLSYNRNFDVDYIVAKNSVKGEEKDLFDLYEIVNAEKIYVNEKYCDASFLNIAKAAEVRVKEYSEE